MVKENAPKYYKCLHLVNNIMENLKIIFNMLFMFFFCNKYLLLYNQEEKQHVVFKKKNCPAFFFFCSLKRDLENTYLAKVKKKE